jgi:catechol 2,3-dioxygenase-like lactoylglutathione lyase family enzyme
LLTPDWNAWTSRPQGAPNDASPFKQIRALDYTVIFVRDMAAMRRFYGEILQFPLERELTAGWIEYRVGSNILALANRSRTAHDPAIPNGAASLQLALRVPPGTVDECAAAFEAAKVTIVEPPKSHAWGHRTLFVRDPDGNLVEIYAEI